MHLEKYTKSQTGQLQKHYQRPLDRDYSNEKIDLNKSYLNYNLAPDRGDISQYLDNRLSEVKHLNRKDINVMCDWIVTLPQEKDYKGDEKQFFQESYNFLANRYGEQNILSSYVHKDETTPHMHFSFIPITVDKDGKEKLCAKEVIDRKELKTIHKEMQHYLEKELQEPCKLINGATANGNKEILELKNQQLEKELQEKQQELEATRQAYSLVNKELQQNRQELEQIKKMPYQLPESKKFFGVEYFPAKEFKNTLMQVHALKLDSDKQVEVAQQERDSYKTALGNKTIENDHLKDKLYHIQEKQFDRGYLQHQLKEVDRIEKEYQNHEREHNHERDLTINGR